MVRLYIIMCNLCSYHNYATLHTWCLGVLFLTPLSGGSHSILTLGEDIVVVLHVYIHTWCLGVLFLTLFSLIFIQSSVGNINFLHSGILDGKIEGGFR